MCGFATFRFMLPKGLIAANSDFGLFYFYANSNID